MTQEQFDKMMDNCLERRAAALHAGDGAEAGRGRGGGSADRGDPSGRLSA